MNNQAPQNSGNFVRAIKKLFLSAFLIFSFAAYVLHRPSSEAAGKLGQVPPAPGAPPATNTLITGQPTATPTAQVAQQDPAQSAPQQQGAAPTATAPAAAPAATNTAPAPATATPAAASNGQYKDGTYTGPQVDAFYGLVQVQTTIQNGKIANVQFLQYPSDRRTSQRINSYAVPVLQQEAVQAQSANVDLITGATLTSQAFAMSLQAALQKAGK